MRCPAAATKRPESGSGCEAFIGWLSLCVSAVLMIVLLIALFWHTALDLQVVIEDYVHSGPKIWAQLATRFMCFALALPGIVVTLRIALGVWASTCVQ